MSSPQQDSGAHGDVVIRRMHGEDEARRCADMMARSEPWITLRRDFAHCLQLLMDTSKETYVALAGAEVAGCILVNMQGPFAGYIQTLVVAQAWRSRGLGAKLMGYAEKRIFRESPNVFLCVSGFNPRAQKFYARLGYERIGELKDYVIGGADEILMRKTIGPKSGFKPPS